MTDEDEVLAANAAFYSAFAASDAKAMDAVWARRAPVACVHPGWEALVGRDRVMESWRRILRDGGASPITCGGAVAHLLGEAARERRSSPPTSSSARTAASAWCTTTPGPRPVPKRRRPRPGPS